MQVFQKKTNKLNNIENNSDELLSKKIKNKLIVSNESLNKIIELVNAGDLSQSQNLALEVTKNFPNNGFGWKILGTIYQKLGNNEQARDALLKAVKLIPTDAEVHFNLANAHLDLKNLKSAKQHYLKAVNIAPNFLSVHFNLANLYKDNNEKELAEVHFKKIIKIDGEHLEALFKLAAIYSEQKRSQECIDILNRVIALGVDNSTVYSSLAIEYAALNNHFYAEESLRKAIDLEPENATKIQVDFALQIKKQGKLNEAAALLNQLIVNDNNSADLYDVYNALGLVSLEQNNIADAQLFFKKTIVLNPKNAIGYINYGLTQLNQGNIVDAEAYSSKALELDPENKVALNNLALAQNQLGKYEQAIVTFEKVIALDPNYVTALSNLSGPLKRIGRLSEAEAYLKRGFLIEPENYDLYINLASIYQGMGLINKAVELNLKAIQINPDKSLPFENLLFDTCYTTEYKPEFIDEQLSLYGKTLTRLAKTHYNEWPEKSNADKLRLGFVSADFIVHPVSTFLKNVLENLDFERFELIAYSNNVNEDDMTRTLKNYFKAWNVIVGVSDAAMAKLIYEDAVDILIDLSGHTGGNRLGVFAYKPAPVQVTWLGYWASTGVEQMDYILLDEISAPLAFQNQFTEKIKYLPETRFCYSPPSFDVSLSPLPALENNYITFGCYHTYAKVSDEALAVWAKVMAKLPNSILCWQTAAFKDEKLINQVHQKMLKFNISKDRILLSSSKPYNEYFKTYHQVDFVLDSFPFTACTTTSDALWMGVPTLTIAGNRLVERQGASLMNAVGLPEWIAKNKDEFVEKAVFFANNLQYLAETRKTLREKLQNSTLGDGQKFAKNFESAILEIWESFQDTSKGNVMTDHPFENDVAILADSIEDVYQLALRHQQSGNEKEAELLYQQLLEINPNHAWAIHNLGFIEFATKGVDTAILRFEKCVTLSPQTEQFWLSYIDALLVMGETSIAISAIEHGKNYGLTIPTADALLDEIDHQLNEQNAFIHHIMNAQKSENKTKNFKCIIAAPVYTDKSAGINVLHKLCDGLNKLGFPTALCFFGKDGFNFSNNQNYYNPDFKWYALRDKKEFDSFIEEGIVVYPEVVTGNPLNAKRVVRYMLNTEGKVAGNKTEASDSDFILAFSKAFHPNPHEVLTVLAKNPLFNQENTLPTEKRKLDITYIGKGSQYGTCYSLANTFEITRNYPAKKEELALLLKNTRYFFSWDTISQINIDAIFCGAIPVFMNANPYENFDKLHEFDCGKFPMATCKTDGDVVEVILPDDYQDSATKFIKNYLHIIDDYQNNLLKVIKKISKHFELFEVKS